MTGPTVSVCALGGKARNAALGQGARLYVDLDGVLADFDAAFPEVFGLDHRGMADDDMWAKINAHPSFFRDLPLCPGAYDAFWALDWPTEPIILTACPRTRYAEVALQKRAWVRAHFGDLTVLPVMGSHNKPLFMHQPGDVLIDDFRKNCAAWSAAGGVAILHRGWPGALAAVRGIFRLKSLGGRVTDTQEAVQR